MKILLSSMMFLSLLSAPSYADQYLIDEMESLKLSLEKNDPDRTELSLRLADLYFDVSIQEGEGTQRIEQRKKALKLYQDALFARDGLRELSARKKIIIKFQIARVLNKLNQQNEAKPYFNAVYSSQLANKKLKRESAFSLAEYYEEKINFNKSNEFYLKAIELCETHESLNYAHYKRAWLHYKEAKLEIAISELKLSLFEKDGLVRDKVVNDLFLFFSARVTNGDPELAYVKKLIKKTGKKDLVKRLVEAFYGAGNRLAGSTVLVQLNEQNPDPFYEMRLLEEFYGFRDVDRLDKYLSRLENRSLVDIPRDKEEAIEFKAMLKRVIVQFASETETNKKFVNILKRSILRYLSFYPNDEMRNKMQQGWLQAEKKSFEKINQLAKWIDEDIKFGFDSKHIRKLRQTRLSLAQKEKKSDVMIVESLAIAKILEKSNESREFHYIAAYELYKNKKYTQAMAIFKSLAMLSSKTIVDKWAIQSQNLVLDILNSKKEYLALIKQADSWLNNKKISEQLSLKKDLLEMKSVKTQASYAIVIGMGENQLALDKFYSFCYAKIYEEKSCANAKVLAIKLKDQSKLISLLEKNHDEKTLMVEYELMGRFSDAAKLQEKYLLTRKASVLTFLKIALLYEVDANFVKRDKVLKKLIAKIKRDKKINKEYETAIYKTLEQANLLNNKTLLLPWSVSKKIQLAQRLSVETPNRENKKIIAAQKSYTGSTWAIIALNKVQALFRKQAKTKFYGRRSKTLFKRRLKKIDTFVKIAKSYLKGSDTQTRIYILDMLKLAYLNLSNEILATPLPKGLTPDILAQVQTSLSQMSTPYATIVKDYDRLQKTELATINPDQQNLIAKKMLDVENVNYSALVDKEEYKIHLTTMSDFGNVKILIKQLSTSPMSLEVLTSLEKQFKENNNTRLAAYFTGRLNSLKESND
ncbi:MAG: hypothetical protein HON90_05330 [Halobacteriovoraceae bacterium]|jgi:hypothetical protein|nr:hypothetical protein [Halobacteriovoraceae bacterium]